MNNSKHLKNDSSYVSLFFVVVFLLCSLQSFTSNRYSKFQSPDPIFEGIYYSLSRFNMQTLEYCITGRLR
jgi:hypothetical protein